MQGADETETDGESAKMSNVKRMTKVNAALERGWSFKFSRSKGDILNETEEALVTLANEIKRLRRTARGGKSAGFWKPRALAAERERDPRWVTVTEGRWRNESRFVKDPRYNGDHDQEARVQVLRSRRCLNRNMCRTCGRKN